MLMCRNLVFASVGGDCNACKCKWAQSLAGQGVSKIAIQKFLDFLNAW